MEFLLVNDDEYELQLQRLELESFGLTVIIADNSDQAASLMETHIFTTAFIDLGTVGAKELIDGIHRKQGDLAVIALTEKPGALPEDCRCDGALATPLTLDSIKALLIEREIPILPEGGPWRRRTDVLFDYDELFYIMPDAKAILRLLQHHLSVHSNYCNTIEKYIKAGDYPSARSMMPNTVDISGNMYCLRLHYASLQLETDLKKHHANSFESFKRIWLSTMGKLAEEGMRLSAMSKVEDNDNDWDTLWLDFISLCKEFDAEAVKLFMEHRRTFAVHLDRSYYNELRKAVASYDFLWIIDNTEDNDVPRIVG